MAAHVQAIETQITRALPAQDVHVLPRATGFGEASLESTVDHLRPEAAADFTRRLVRVLMPSDPSLLDATPAEGAADRGDATPP